MQTMTSPSNTKLRPRDAGFHPYVAGGETYWLREPSTARDVLDVEIHIAARLIDGENVSSVNLSRLIGWVARHVFAGPVPAEDMRTHIDEHFSLDGILRMKNAIVALGGLPEKVLSDVALYHQVIHSGGCECPVCVGGPRYEDAGPSAKEAMVKMCSYKDIPPITVNILNLSHGLESTDILLAPWWAYQLEAAKRTGKSRAYIEKDRAEKTKTSVDKILKGRRRWAK